MTKEEYEDCVSKVDSEDLGERLQARMLLAMFPTYEATVDYTEDGVAGLQKAISGVLKRENQIA